MGEILGKKESDKDLINNIKPILMTTNDIPQIIEIYKSFWGTQNLYQNSLLEKIISLNMSYAYKIKNELIAFCLMAYNNKKKLVSVILLCVKKEYQGKKLGKSLLSFCINNCKNYNLRNFDLHVSTTNLTAFIVYKKLGFVVNSFIENYYHDKNPKDNNAYYMTLNT